MSWFTFACKGQYHKSLGWSPWSVGWWRGLAVDYCRPLVAAQPPPSRTLLLSFILLSYRFCWSTCLFLPNHHHPREPSFYFLQVKASTSLKFRFHLVSLSNKGKQLRRTYEEMIYQVPINCSSFSCFVPCLPSMKPSTLKKVYSWSAISGSYINYNCLALQ